MEIISTKKKGLLKSDEFLKISSQCLMFLLDQDALSVSEAELFNAVSSNSLLLLINEKLCTYTYKNNYSVKTPSQLTSPEIRFIL